MNYNDTSNQYLHSTVHCTRTQNSGTPIIPSIKTDLLKKLSSCLYSSPILTLVVVVASDWPSLSAGY